MKRKPPKFESEAALVAAYCTYVDRINYAYRHLPESHMRWTVYAETAGFDLLLVQDVTGVQVGIEAKLTLNLKVLEQALPSRYDGFHRPSVGPDYRAVLVPSGGTQNNLPRIAELLGLTVLHLYNSRHDPADDDGFVPWDGYVQPPKEWMTTPGLPDETYQGSGLHGDHWMPWLPEERCELPAYIPDVPGGVASPVKLSLWKVKAIRLMVVLDLRGYVTRSDMRALDISPTRWCGYDGFLKPNPTGLGWVRCDRTPDFRAQHERVYAEVEADFKNWAGNIALTLN